MKNREKFILGITSIAMAAFIIYLSKRKKAEKMLTRIADEGYETAGDILFPLRSRKERRGSRNYNLNSLQNNLFY